jgi:hypothetical protein
MTARNLDLPGCGGPATVRIEVYTLPSDGHDHGSLDASVYACADHVGAMVSVIGAASLTAYSCEAPMLLARPCGHVYAYPSAHLGGGR